MFLERHSIEMKFPWTMPAELKEELLSWSILHKSPHSNSFYNVEKDWGETPIGTIRVSDHWNYKSGGKLHAPIKRARGRSTWTMAIWTGEEYEILKEYSFKNLWELSGDEAKDYLSLVNYNNKPLWVKEQIFKVLDMEIGNHTPAPKGIYYD